MTRALVAVLVVAGLTGAAWWQLTPTRAAQHDHLASPQITAPAFDSAKAFEHLKAIVNIGPRPAGSAQLRQTRAYITGQISSAGLQVEEQPFTAQTPIGPVEMVNLIVRLPGKRPDRLLVTGHYDTKLFKDQKFVGANDGGSSAAFLIELARVLKDQPRELTYELVWFDGEEAFVDWNTNSDNTYGSRHYVQAAQKAKALSAIKTMVLVDMIGDRDLRILRESNSTPWLTEIIWAAANRAGHGGTFVDQITAIEDDHLPFLKAGVPAVDLIDLEYPAWHHVQECCDDMSRVSARSLQIVGEVLLAALPEIEKRILSGK
jgi:Zn-dependent M28 family amino/carboxypeptidase